MIAFVDTLPDVEMKAGQFLVTFESGGEEVKLMLTPHAFRGLIRRSNRASDEHAEAQVAERQKVVAFPKPKRGRA